MGPRGSSATNGSALATLSTQQTVVLLDHTFKTGCLVSWEEHEAVVLGANGFVFGDGHLNSRLSARRSRPFCRPAPKLISLAWVSGDPRRRAKEHALREAAPREVSAGTIVWWEQGELHETRTETGLTAIVIEAESLDPAIRAALATEPPTS
jgi:hypothetical protein